MKILITGGSGFVGRNIIKFLGPDYDIYAPTSSQLDLTDEKEVEKYFQNKFFDVIIHCAIKGGRRNEIDSSFILQGNLQMFFNLMNNKNRFDRLINFSSGADFDKTKNININNHSLEKSYPIRPYDMSKNIISRILKSCSRCYNFRIYGVFGIDEAEDRFITSNIKRFKTHNDIVIHKNRYWDFFYIKDLINILKYYLDNPTLDLDNEMELIYQDLLSLKDVAELINNLDKNKVKIRVDDNTRDLDYLGNKSYGVNLPIELIGLKKGLEEIYNAL
jgi:nucleoside-diphosphate-sugar epimerase|tara:strand:+ start:22 stop:846 length:825 start_codon:yes stop_codon:yes gene_type:complete